MLFCACAKEEQTTENIRKSITASIDGNSLTRAAVRDVNIVWTDDDAIKVFNADGTANEVWNISSDDSGLETARFYFIGEPQLASGEEAFAAFHAASVSALSDSKLTMTLPETIAFDTQTVDEEDLVKTVIPMWATWGSSLTFHHLAAVVKVDFNNLPVGTTELILSSSTQHLSGTFTSGTLSESDLPELTYSEGGSQSVSVTFPATTATENRTVFLPIPAGTYDLKLQARVGSELRDVKSWATREFARGKLYRAGINYVELTASSPADISDGLSAIADGDKVEINVVSAEAGGISTEDNATIAIPAIGGNASIGLTFSEPVVTPEGHPLVITDNCEGESAEAQNSLTITLPDATGIDLYIDLPMSTVTLATSGTATVYKNVSARTAINTLIVGPGVRIETLATNGGNVILDGGRVDNLINVSSEGTTVTATSSDELIGRIITLESLTLGSNEPDAKQLTVGAIDVVDGTVNLVNCKVTGTVKHNSGEPIKMTCSDSNYIETLTLDMSSAGVEVYGTINKLNVQGNVATIDCKHSASGCGINSLHTDGEIDRLIWRTPDPGILSRVTYKARFFTIETSSTSPQEFMICEGGEIRFIELEKDINVFLATGSGSWGDVDRNAGTYESVYLVRSFNGSVGDDVVDLTFPDESNICYSFPSIDVAYDYASVIRDKKAMNFRLNFNHNSEKCFAFGDGTDVTVDLNGHTVSFLNRHNFGTEDAPLYSNIHLSDGAKLTFTGSGKVTSDVETDAFCYVHVGELRILGGEFEADGAALLLDCCDANCTSPDTATARISVTGGRFHKFNPADNLADGPGTNYVPSGYVSTADGDWFTVHER